MSEQFCEADYHDCIVKILFSSSQHIPLDAVKKMASPNFDWNQFNKIANDNRVLVRCKNRLVEILAKVDDKTDNKTFKPSFPKEHFIKDMDRDGMQRDFSLMNSVENKFREQGIDYVIMKTLDQYPDLGRDLDFLVSPDHFEKAKKIVTDEFGGRPLPLTLCDRLAGKVSYGIFGHERSVELYPKISQLGEYYFSTVEVIRNRQEKIVDGSLHYVTSPEDQILIACVHRLYRHWMLGVRISDVYNVWELMDREKIDMTYVSSMAGEGGASKALPVFLNLVEDIGRGRMPMTIFPYKLPFYQTVRLFMAKIVSDIRKGRLRILLAPALVLYGYISLMTFKKNYIW